MKYIITFLIFLSVSKIQAQVSESELKKMANVIEKNGLCDLAIGFFFVSDTKGPRSVTCVGEIILNANTMNEKSGCAVFTFDLYTLQTKGIGGYKEVQIAEGTKCDEEGSRRLLNRPFFGKRLGDVIFFGEVVEGRHERKIVYQKSSKQFFTKIRDEFKKEYLFNQEKQRKEAEEEERKSKATAEKKRNEDRNAKSKMKHRADANYQTGCKNLEKAKINFLNLCKSHFSPGSADEYCVCLEKNLTVLSTALDDCTIPPEMSNFEVFKGVFDDPKFNTKCSFPRKDQEENQ